MRPFHLWANMEVRQCKSGLCSGCGRIFQLQEVKRFTVAAALWDRTLSCKRTALITILVSFTEWPPRVSLEFSDSRCIYCWTDRCETNQHNSVNILEDSSHHFPWRLHCRELLFDWRVRMLPGHRFSLALWGVVEDTSLISCNNSA
jgi:hypothetical protein